MNTVLVQLGLLACSFALAFGTQCLSCNTALGADCTSSSDTCSSSYCVTTSVTTDGDTVTTYSCLPSCTESHTQIFDVETDVSCCQSSMCNRPGTSGGDGDDDELKCYSCGSTSSGECTEERTCSSYENYCMKTYTRAGDLKSYYYGCTAGCVEADAFIGDFGTRTTCCQESLCNAAPRGVTSSLWMLSAVTALALCSVIMLH